MLPSTTRAMYQRGQAAFTITLASLLPALIIFTILAMVVISHKRDQRYKQYPYSISLSVLEFGNINGDEYPDMVTFGYKGMIGGNPLWFEGRGRGFGDRSDGHRFEPSEAQLGMRFLDLDSDGDLDYLSGRGVFENAGDGTFVNRIQPPQGSPYASSYIKLNGRIERSEPFLALTYVIGQSGMRFFEACDIFCADLTGDGLPEIVFIGEQVDFEDSQTKNSLILGVSKSRMEWEFVCCPSHFGFSLDREKSELVILSVPLRKKKKPWPIIVRRFDYDSVFALLKKHKVRHRCPTAPCPLMKKRHGYGADHAEFHWLDLDKDGQQELAICGQRKGGKPLVSIYRQDHEDFTLLSEFETKPFNCRDHSQPFRTMFPIFQFIDFDRDDRLDLLGQDGHVYQQGDKFQFKRMPALGLEGDGATAYFQHDLNNDGWPDVIASYNPYWNIKMGPVIP
ncbi:MAG: FG-GAP-like repeat-containing protein [Planctomycetota bacterium]|jgi:hypothetical protein|nr:FG-GAP-like repeat-containing protein [Planctomycetota bacterium]MDP6502297.1 FG-GAP-like repeat-containing protein [Planctomycetota bacterium]